jgi:hypothetical protein
MIKISALLICFTLMAGLGMEAVITPIAGKDGYIELESVTPKNPELWMEFKVPFMPESYAEGGAKPIKVALCDYASAGNAKDSHPFFKVWPPQLYDPRK